MISPTYRAPLQPNALEDDIDLIDYPESDGQPMTESDPTRDYLIYSVEVLRQFFQSRSDVYVSGNLFIYYQQGSRQAVVSPDVFVIFGVANRQRRSYKLWEENYRVPSFILEITSRTTWEIDEVEKPARYAQLGVQEYFQYDPTGDYLTPSLKGQTLVEGQYRPLTPEIYSDGQLCFHSQTLKLDLRLTAGALRFYIPATGERLLTYQESEQARQEAEQARQEAEQARQQAEQARLDAVPRLAAMGLSAEQIAEVLGLPIATILSLLGQ